VTVLADTSAWIVSRRSDQPTLRARFDEQVVNGAIATCDMVRLELLHGARNARQFASLRAALAALPDCPVGEAEWAWALDVYEALAAKAAHQRAVKHADLLIAAAAFRADVPIVHYDEDYDRISAITGQATTWIAPRGSV
jgi:predicted nucleic acid-binding protein